MAEKVSTEEMPAERVERWSVMEAPTVVEVDREKAKAASEKFVAEHTAKDDAENSDY